ncbi:hypothetical protein J4Q44_G00288790 [Coregonus suidteri]|uniref:DDE Tnp4 domain-containing protein n=1 Tax=Coregonus suidteri TaxID=861788 RepID=A0AAN8LGR8_9TELE
MACPFVRDVVDEEALVLRRAFRRERVFRDRLDPLAFPDDHLYERYRFSADGIRRLCDIKEEFYRIAGEFSGVLLGDRGYGCQPFLLTPFTDPQEAQQAYNHAHARTRARVEMTFGLLKARFHCLHKLRVSPVRACDITVACAVLHNVACLRKERAPRVPPAMDWDNPAIFPDDDSGRLLRDQYVLNYFS